jgi:hypothetical protein
MSSRVLGYSLLVVLVAAFTLSMAPTQQPLQNPAIEPRWEYKVLRLDSYACSSENEVAKSLNALGQQRWELVSYQLSAPPFPKDAEGTLVIAPAATGPSRDTNPPTADSFQGTIELKMAQVQPQGCSMLLKRQWHPGAQP